MTNRQALTLMAAATVVLALIAPLAFADNNSNNGDHNTINDTNNSGVGNGNTTITTGSNNPTVSATGGTSSATGGSSSAKGGNASANNHNSNRQSQRQAQRQSQTSKSSVKASGNSSNSYVAQAQARNPVSTAFAAPLVAAEDTCMGSSSAGGQGVGFGLSIGTTWHDGDCVRRKDARELHNMGQRVAALALMCQNDNVRNAMATAGTPCPGRADDDLVLNEDRHPAERRTAAVDGTIYEYPTQVRRWQQ